MSRLKTIALWALLVLLSAFLIRVVWVWIEGPKAITAPIVFELAAAAQETGAEFDYRPLATEGNDPESPELREAVRSALPSSQQILLAESEAPAGALRSALDFLSALGSGDAAQYAKWRRDQGFHLVERYPTTGWRPRRWFEGPYQGIVGRPMPDDLPVEDYFRDVFDAYFAQDDGAVRPVAVAVSPLTAEMLPLGCITHADELTTAVPEAPDGLGPDYWRGGISAVQIRLFEPDRDLSALITEHGCVWAAEVRLTAQGALGHALPMAFTLVYDPDRGWRVIRWVSRNYGRHAGVTDAVIGATVF